MAPSTEPPEHPRSILEAQEPLEGGEAKGALEGGNFPLPRLEDEEDSSRAFLVLLPDRSVRLYACASLTAGRVLSDFPNHTLSLLPSRHVSLSLLPDVTLLPGKTYYLHQQPGALASTSSFGLPGSFSAATTSASAGASPCHVAAPDAAMCHRPLRKHGVSCQFPSSASFEPEPESLLQKRSTFPGPMPLNPQYYSQPFPAPPNRQRTSRASLELPQALLGADVSKRSSGAVTVTPATRVQGLPSSRSFNVPGRRHERTPSVPEEAFGGEQGGGSPAFGGEQARALFSPLSDQQQARSGNSPAFFLPSLSPSSTGVVESSPAAGWFKPAQSSASSCSVSPFHSQVFGRLPPLPRGTLSDDLVAMHLGLRGVDAGKREGSGPGEDDPFGELNAFLQGGKQRKERKDETLDGLQAFLHEGKQRAEREDETLDELKAFLHGGKQRRERPSAQSAAAAEHAPPLHRSISALAFNDRRVRHSTVHEKPQERTVSKNSILAELEELEAQEAADQGLDPTTTLELPSGREAAAAAVVVAADTSHLQAGAVAAGMKKPEGQLQTEERSKGQGSILSKLSSRFGAAKRLGTSHKGSSKTATGGGGHDEWNAATLHYSMAL